MWTSAKPRFCGLAYYGSSCFIIAVDLPALTKVYLIAIYVIEASIPTIILFCVICEDVDDLYKRQTFRPSSLHQRQISMKATGPKRLPFI